eukprot:873337-Pelagomonas_calceolata.AAC.9
MVLCPLIVTINDATNLVMPRLPPASMHGPDANVSLVSGVWREHDLKGREKEGYIVVPACGGSLAEAKRMTKRGAAGSIC